MSSPVARPAAPVGSQPMGLGSWGMLLGLSVIWGASFLFIGVAVLEVPPSTIVAVRITLAALAMVVVLRMLGQALPTGSAAWRDLVVMALLSNVLPFTLISWGQSHIPAGLAAILNATVPLFTALIGWLATRTEPLGPGRVAGLVLGFLGVVCVLGPKVQAGATVGVLGAVAVLGAAVSYGLGAQFGRRYAGQAPTVTTGGMLLAGAPFALVIALITDRPWTLSPSATSVAALVALALVCTAAAYLVFFRLMRTVGPTNTTTVTFLVPLSAVALGALFLDERLAWNAFAGMALIFCGLAALDGRVARMLRARRAAMAAAE